MQPPTDNRNCDNERNPSSHHIPLRPHKVPLLEHHHLPLNFARLHHARVPRHGEPGYAHYKAVQQVVIANAIREFEKELFSRTTVEQLDVQSEKLILRLCSQSKLSQQELADLQKATHFDKKELQQWYKGAHSQPVTLTHSS